MNFQFCQRVRDALRHALVPREDWRLESCFTGRPINGHLNFVQENKRFMPLISFSISLLCLIKWLDPGVSIGADLAAGWPHRAQSVTITAQTRIVGKKKLHDDF